jgi:uncharacterized SAM-binding protein YcdF (DUF218 family)
VVLGCRVTFDDEGRLAGALGRRVARAAALHARHGDGETVVVASGGRRWSGHVEADAMARELVLRGVPEKQVVRERCSLSTADNARFAAAVLARRGMSGGAVVTCAWHVPRAVALFEQRGLRVEGVAAAAGEARWTHRIWRWGRERVLSWAQTARS